MTRLVTHPNANRKLATATLLGFFSRAQRNSNYGWGILLSCLERCLELHQRGYDKKWLLMIIERVEAKYGDGLGCWSALSCLL